MKLSRILFLFFLSFLIVGCGGGLSRSKAGELISGDKNFSEPIKAEFRYGKVYGRGVGENFGLLTGISENREIYSVLNSLGYIEMGYDPNPLMDDVKLTEKGRKESANWEKSKNMLGDSYKIPVAKREITEVTGLSQPKQGENIVQATFTWKWKPMNDIGEALGVGKDKNETYNGTATFQKFDDGWRVVNISGDGISPGLS